MKLVVKSKTGKENVLEWPGASSKRTQVVRAAVSINPLEAKGTFREALKAHHPNWRRRHLTLEEVEAFCQQYPQVLEGGEATFFLMLNKVASVSSNSKKVVMFELDSSSFSHGTAKRQIVMRNRRRAA
jgi:hypothetical protein